MNDNLVKTDMSTRENYASINGLKTIACIGIAMMHILTNTDYQVEGFLFEYFIPALTDLVFLFMCISAFGMCCGYHQRFIDKSIDISNFYIKRYKKILPFFSLLCVIDFVFSPSLKSIYEIITNLTLCFGLIPGVKISVIGVGWFLGLIFAFYLLFPFFVFLTSNKKRVFFAFLVSFVMNYICINYFDIERTSIVYCFIYFLAGGIIYIYRNEIMSIPHMPMLSLIGLIISTILYFIVGNITIFTVLISSFALVMAITLRGKNLLNNAFTAIIGGVSFEIYLSHMLFYRFFEKLHLLKLFQNDYINYWVVVIGVLVCSYIFSFTAKKILDKIMILFEAVNVKHQV